MLLDARVRRMALLVVFSVSTSGCGFFCHFNNSCGADQQCGSGPASASCPPADTVTVGSKQLTIVPIAQQTLEWCWLASAEMIFRYYNVPQVNGISYQCGVMGTVSGPNSICFYNCAACVFGSGSDANSARVLVDYPAILQQYFFPAARIPRVSAQLYERQLKMSEVQQEIDKGHPIELGITVGGPFQGQAAHDVVLIGYSAPNTTTLSIVIDDPFPYDLIVGPGQNPYRQLGATVLQPGQYQLPYNVAAPGLQWSASITTAPF
jgi:hypothetical protein